MLSCFLGNAAYTEASRHMGIVLPIGAKLIEPNRFVSPRPYAETLREMRLRFAGLKHITQIGDEINLPHVRATSFANADKKAPFMAINIYTNLQTGLTEIYFVSRKS